MTNEEIRDASLELHKMSVRLGQIRKQLNTTSSKCGSCSMNHYHNYADHQAAQQLDGAIGRLAKTIDLLDMQRDEGGDHAKS